MGSSMGFTHRDLFRCLYYFMMLLITLQFIGNVLNMWITLPWHATFLHLMSWNNTFTRDQLISWKRLPPRHDSRPLLDCGLHNVNFDAELLRFAMDDSRHKNVTKFYKTQKIYGQNEHNFSAPYGYLVSKVHGDLFYIHARFLEILMRNAIQNAYKPEVMKGILPLVRRQLDEHNEVDKFAAGDPEDGQGTTQPYKTCAVVGNSGILWKSQRGQEIDSHEMVIRLNNAISKEKNQTILEAHIGTKTNLTFMNSHVLHQCMRKFRRCKCHPYGEWVPIMLYLCTPDHAIDVACCSFAHKSPLFVAEGGFDIFVSRLATWYSVKHYVKNYGGTLEGWETVHMHEFHYSSGFQAVIVALALCEKVDLYGFGKAPRSKHHFHSDQKREHYAHDFRGEYLFYDDLEAKRFYDNPFLCEAGIHIPQVRVFH